MGEDDDDVSAFVRGLAGLGNPEALDAVSRREPFVITVQDVAIRVEYTVGTTPTVFLSTPYAPRAAAHRVVGAYRDAAVAPLWVPRPLFLELGRETADDRQAKARGISREVQTGDAGFDRLVYVTCPTPEPAAAALASARLRSAVQVLFADGFDKIVIDDEDGEITTKRGLSTLAGADAAAIAAAFATIAAEVPPIEGPRLRTHAWPALAVLCLVFAALAGLIAALVLGPFPASAAGLVVGTGAGVGAGVLVGRTQRGHSNSHWRIRVAVVACACAGILLGGLGGLLVGGADASAIGWFVAIPSVIAGSLALALARAGT